MIKINLLITTERNIQVPELHSDVRFFVHLYAEFKSRQLTYWVHIHQPS